MKKAILLSLFISLFLMLPEITSAQCAMCKAVVESNGDSDVIEGVNNGILYMMGFPYLLMLVIGFAWYKKYGKSLSNN